MYEVEIQSEVRPNVWFRVDEPHLNFWFAVKVAGKLADSYNARGHMRVSRYGRPILEVS